MPIQLPPTIGPFPFWFWNSSLTHAEAKRQLRAMHAQHVPGVFVHCRSGMRPRYLSNDWWALVEVVAAEARELGMTLGFVDDFNWPSGEARDLDLGGAPSRVLAAVAKARMRCLRPRSVADGTYSMEQFDSTEALVGLCHDDSGVLADVRSLGPELDRLKAAGGVVTRADHGVDEIRAYDLADAVGFDGGTVDLLNKAAVSSFIGSTHAEYSRRLAPYLGDTVTGFFIDHEGDYGYRLAWTKDLPEEFLARTGRDFAATLPLLADESTAGKRARFDYLDVISTLYSTRFFGEIRSFCEDRGMWVSGHTWEESLHMQAAYLGNPFDFQRSLSKAGIDTLFEWARSSRHFIEAATVSRISGRPLVVEAQGVQGVDSFLSPATARELSALATLWGATVLIPHAFNSNHDRTDFPEDWFESQPWWPHFNLYCDYAKELSRFNQFGQPVGATAIYYPAETTWANAAPVFDDARWNYFMTAFDPGSGPILRWDNSVDELDDAYSAVIDWAAKHSRRIDSIDFRYVCEATIETEGSLVVGHARYKLIVLMPMDVIHIDAARQLCRFIAAGGTVLALRNLPNVAVGADDCDGELAQIWRKAMTANEGGCLEVYDSLDSLLTRLHRLDPAPIGIDGPSDVALAHRYDGSNDLVLIASTSGRGGTVRLVGAFTGSWWWQPLEPGMPVPIDISGTDRTHIDFDLQPGEARLLAGQRSKLPSKEETSTGAGKPIAVEKSTRSSVMTLNDWEVTPLPANVPICYGSRFDVADPVASVLDAPDPALDPVTVWLSSQEHCVRGWQVLGPFPYGFHDEYYTDDDWRSVVDNDIVNRRGAQRQWADYTSPTRHVDLDIAFGSQAERGSGPRWISGYAKTTIVSDHERNDVFLRIVAESNARVWLNGILLFAERDDHQGYLELRDAFGFAIPLPLRKGANQLLVKVSQAARYGGMFGFAARLCDADGLPSRDLQLPTEPQTVDHVLEFDIPRGVQELVLQASGHHVVRIGDAVLDRVDSSVIPIDQPSKVEQTVRCAFTAGGQLLDWPVAVVGPARATLGCLSRTALAYHCGLVQYRCDINLGQTAPLRAVLELGEVGVTAEVEVNGKRIGARAWPPFQFDLTGELLAGNNAIIVLVRNTRSSERARGPEQTLLWGVPCRGPDLLDRMDPNGLQGPVTLHVESAS